MAQRSHTPLNSRLVQKHLKQGAKSALIASGIEPSSRRGNKELNILVKQLAQRPYANLNEALEAGKVLGQQIAQKSQEKGKPYLDGGIVRQMVLQGERPNPSDASVPAEAKATHAPSRQSDPVEAAATTVIETSAPKTASTSPESAEAPLATANPAEAEDIDAALVDAAVTTEAAASDTGDIDAPEETDNLGDISALAADDRFEQDTNPDEAIPANA